MKTSYYFVLISENIVNGYYYEQKNGLSPLRMLINCHMHDGTYLKKNSSIYADFVFVVTVITTKFSKNFFLKVYNRYACFLAKK